MFLDHRNFPEPVCLFLLMVLWQARSHPHYERGDPVLLRGAFCSQWIQTFISMQDGLCSAAKAAHSLMSLQVPHFFTLTKIGTCYGLKCLPPTPNSHVKILTLNVTTMLEGRALERWLVREGRALMNGISVPSTMWGHIRKTDACESDTKSARALMLDFPDSRTVRKKCLLFQSPSLWYFY